MKLYYFYYENGYTKKFVSMCKEKIEEYRKRLLSQDKTKSIGEIKSVTLNNYEDIVEI